MKVHKLIIENIASLRGIHEVNFDSFINESQLFAITGDTGAGKSTILNCITLALYGKHYKKNIIHYDMVTLGEREGSVELFFEARNQNYKAVFKSTVRKTNGEFLKKAKSFRELYLIKEHSEVIEDKNPEDIINLTFDQFCKTVILNQGMFADFLTSDFRERKEIIEKLYRGEKLNLLNPKLREKINIAIKEKDKLIAKRSGLTQGHETVIDQVALNNLKIKLEKENENLQTFENAYKKSNDLHKLYADYHKYKDKEALTREEINKLSLKSSQINQEFDKIEIAIETFSKNYDEKLNILIQAQGLDNQNKKITQKIHELEKSQNEQKQKQQDNTKNHIEIISQIDKLNKDIQKIKLKEDEIIPKHEIQKINKIFKEYQKTNQSLILAKQKEESIKTQEKDLNNKKHEIEKEIETLNKSLLQANKKFSTKNLKDSEQTIIDLNKLEFNKDEKKKIIFKREQQNILHKKNIVDIEKKLKSIKYDLDSIKQQESDLSKLKELEILIIAKNQCIHQSNKDKKCTICATPLNSEIELLPLTNNENDYEKRLNQLSESINQKTQEDLLFRNNLKQLQSKILDCNQKNQEDKAQLSAALAKYFPKITKDPFEANIQDLIKSTKAQIEDYKRSEHQITITKSKLEHNKTLFKDFSQQTAQLNENLKDLNITLSTLSETLTRLKEQSPFKLEYLEELIEINNNYHTKQNSLFNLVKEKEYISNQIEEIKEQDKKINIEKAELENERIKNVSFINEHCNNISPIKLLENLKEKRNQNDLKKKEISQKRNQLNEEKINLDSRLSNTKEQLQDINKLFIINLTELSHLLNFSPWNEYKIIELKISIEPAIFETFKSKIDYHYKAIKENYQRSYEKYVQEKAVFDQNLLKENEIQQIDKKLKHINTELSQWEELYSLIGKDEFRNYILAIVERNLIHQTNIELEKLCDSRYQIEHLSKSNKASQDFYIKDRLNGDELRKVSTLSGGETFMVSLAMALALAELSRGEAELDSFFIDEGFGTLDQDSLEDVFNMLNDIQSSGKQIGLISHIKDLTQRIPININLSKNRMGNSTVNIVYN